MREGDSSPASVMEVCKDYSCFYGTGAVNYMSERLWSLCFAVGRCINEMNSIEKLKDFSTVELTVESFLSHPKRGDIAINSS